jgi:hypothetical protein
MVGILPAITVTIKQAYAGEAVLERPAAGERVDT